MTRKASRPVARKSDIVVQELNEEILICDVKINKVYVLNSTSALVWELSDGTRTLEEIARLATERLKQHVTEDVVRLALDLLKKDDPLANGTDIDTNPDRVSRREMIRRAAMTSMVVVPVLLFQECPPPGAAGSGCGQPRQECSGDFGTQGSCCEDLICSPLGCIPPGETA